MCDKLKLHFWYPEKLYPVRREISGFKWEKFNKRILWKRRVPLLRNTTFYVIKIDQNKIGKCNLLPLKKELKAEMRTFHLS